MGIFDKAREALTEHAGTFDPVVDRPAEAAGQRTGGTRDAQVDRAADLAKDKLGDLARRDAAPEPGTPA